MVMIYNILNIGIIKKIFRFFCIFRNRNYNDYKRSIASQLKNMK